MTQYQTIPTDVQEETDWLEQILKNNDYLRLRSLEDGTIIALGKLLYTIGLYVNVSPWGWERRYCYDNQATAITAFETMVDIETEPSGWIARRPERSW